MIRLVPTVLISAMALSATLDAQTQASPPLVPPATGATGPIVTNPKFIEFEILEQSSPVLTYRLELFRSGVDTTSAQANWVVDLRPRDVPVVDAVARIDLLKAIEGIPNGEYVATLQVMSSTGESPRSIPTPPFAVVNMGRRSASSAGIPGTVVQPGQPPAAPSQSGPPERRLWTIIGIAMGVAAFIGPVVFR